MLLSKSSTVASSGIFIGRGTTAQYAWAQKSPSEVWGKSPGRESGRTKSSRSWSGLQTMGDFTFWI